MVARCAGAKDAQPSDFLIGDGAPDKEPTPQETMAALAAVLGRWRPPQPVSGSSPAGPVAGISAAGPRPG